MTLSRTKSGIFEGDFRAKGVARLHLSLRTKDADTAEDRHAAVKKLYRQKRFEMIEQLRSGVLTIERLEAMVEHHEPLVPVMTAVVESVPAESPWPTVDAASRSYLDAIVANPNRTDATHANSSYQLKRWRDFVFEGQRIGDRTLDRVPSAAVQAYQKSMIDADDPPNTITTYMARVGALWRWAIEQEDRLSKEQRRDARLLYSPVDRESLYREVRRRDRVLTIAECDALMIATPAQYRFAVACGLLAGLRIGETLHLRPGLDVDLEMGTITIRKQSDWKPKTKRSARMVPMAPALLSLAKTHAEQYATAAWMHPSTVYQGEPITELGFRKHFKASVERAGMTYGRDEVQGVVYHTLRHSFASHAVMRGVDLYTVSKLLGDSFKTVEDVYADLSPDHKRAAVATLAGAFSFVGGPNE